MFEESLIFKMADGESFVIRKFNPYHDQLGRFTTPQGAISYNFRSKDNALAYSRAVHDRANEREKKHHRAEQEKEALEYRQLREKARARARQRMNESAQAFKEKVEDRAKQTAAIERAREKNTPKYQAYRQYEQKLIDKYMDHRQTSHYQQKMTNEEYQMLTRLRNAVAEKKNGRWYVAKSVDDYVVFTPVAGKRLIFYRKDRGNR